MALSEEDAHDEHDARSVEVSVRVQERSTGSYARGGDQAVEGLPDRHALPAGGTIEARGEHAVVESFEPKDRKGAKVTLHQRRLLL